MRSLKQVRTEKGITQPMLEEMSGINQTQISLIERGRQKPNKETWTRIEKVLGKIDWSETHGIMVRGDYAKAERLANKLIGIVVGLNSKEQRAIKQLLFKYFKMEEKENETSCF